MALQSFLAGRKVCTPGDLRPNLYLLALASSGTGKDFPRKVNSRVLFEVGLVGAIGDKFASGEGIQDALVRSNAMLFQNDEMDGVLRQINLDRENRRESIPNILLTLYTSANDVYPIRVKAGQKETIHVNQPHLTLFGTATPQFFYESLSQRMLTNGFFARMIVIDVGKRGAGQTPGSARHLPEAILAIARWWADSGPARAICRIPIRNRGSCPSGRRPQKPCSICRGSPRWNTTAPGGPGRGRSHGLEPDLRERTKLALVYACQRGPPESRDRVAGGRMGHGLRHASDPSPALPGGQLRRREPVPRRMPEAAAETPRVGRPDGPAPVDAGHAFKAMDFDQIVTTLAQRGTSCRSNPHEDQASTGVSTYMIATRPNPTSACHNPSHQRDGFGGGHRGRPRRVGELVNNVSDCPVTDFRRRKSIFSRYIYIIYIYSSRSHACACACARVACAHAREGVRRFSATDRPLASSLRCRAPGMCICQVGIYLRVPMPQASSQLSFDRKEFLHEHTRYHRP